MNDGDVADVLDMRLSKDKAGEKRSMSAIWHECYMSCGEYVNTVVVKKKVTKRKVSQLGGKVGFPWERAAKP